MVAAHKNTPALDNLTASQIERVRSFTTQSLMNITSRTPAQQFGILSTYAAELADMRRHTLDNNTLIRQEQATQKTINLATNISTGNILLTVGGACFCFAVLHASLPLVGIALAMGCLVQFGLVKGFNHLIRRNKLQAHPALVESFDSRAQYAEEFLNSLEKNHGEQILKERETILAETPLAETRLTALFNRATDQSRFYEGLDAPLPTNGKRLVLSAPAAQR